MENIFYKDLDTKLPDWLFADIWRRMDAWDWVIKWNDELFNRFLYYKEKELR